MISTTFGTGGSYAKLSEAFAAVLPAGYATWTNDYEFIQVGDCDQESDDILRVASQLFMDGHSLTIKSNAPHYGNPNAGHLLSSDAITAINFGVTNNVLNTGNIYLQDLNVFATYDAGAFTSRVLALSNSTGGTMYAKVHIERCILRNSCTDQAMSNQGVPCRITNSKIDGYINGTHDFAAISDAELENNIFYSGCSFAAFQHTVRNCVSTEFAMTVKNSIGYNNARIGAAMTNADWKTGSSGNIGNVVEANEFKSTDQTADDWLFLKNNYGDSGVLAKGGMLPLYVTEDIAGLAIPDPNNYYPIGCHRCLLSEKSIPKSSIMAISGNSLYSIGRKDQFGDDVESLLITNNEGNTNADGSKKYMDILINS